MEPLTRRLTLDSHLPPHFLDRALREDARGGLTATPKSLPPKWFYDDAGSLLFDRITRLPEYYPTRAEAEVLRAQRMETIGALAGSLAHDLNNSIVPILVGLELLRDEPISPTMRELLDTMTNSARRASEMVQQVLSFARGVGGQLLY